jgi:ATP-dependent DNA helicase RecG
LYGDLDLSILDELPPGRTPVKTRIVPEEKRKDMFGFVRREVRKGRQAYVICPLVAESEAVEAKSAEELFEELKELLPDLRLSLVHGRMKSKDKDAALEKFRAGETDVLVSTTVVEVGVNVPNASTMVVENAERFGLAQLHQLRGRVGRGPYESWCFLVAEPSERLTLLTRTADGFKIAEKDMELRGPGELFGERQSGMLATGLTALAGDTQLLKLTHDEAQVPRGRRIARGRGARAARVSGAARRRRAELNRAKFGLYASFLQ